MIPQRASAKTNKTRKDGVKSSACVGCERIKNSLCLCLAFINRRPSSLISTTAPKSRRHIQFKFKQQYKHSLQPFAFNYQPKPVSWQWDFSLLRNALAHLQPDTRKTASNPVAPSGESHSYTKVENDFARSRRWLTIVRQCRRRGRKSFATTLPVGGGKLLTVGVQMRGEKEREVEQQPHRWAAPMSLIYRGWLLS